MCELKLTPESHIAAEEVQWFHPKDHPPPHGVKLLIYMHPHGTLVVGQWQHSGGSLWSPLLAVPKELKTRLEKEYGTNPTTNR